ncbi:hypothetical protein SCLCIDRAFT_1218285 [Scleroderma citrinum Foug A]|uniref:Uncharacterized protein n=1 Tax=Scleroderma citrinum Foug A TaxID=1036808 RepID=A0A0C2ZA48_9AGAM|nr:hypothetical protein SCLCIDRAFT_1218285 [Scleroderma citrinum Foug A]
MKNSFRRLLAGPSKGISGVLDGHVHPSPETKRDFVSNDPVSIQCLRPYCALTTPSSLTSDIHRWCDSNS